MLAVLWVTPNLLMGEDVVIHRLAERDGSWLWIGDGRFSTMGSLPAWIFAFALSRAFLADARDTPG